MCDAPPPKKLKPLTPVARKLRRTSTEARLWPHLRARQLDGVKFTRQFVIGPHIADFASRNLHLAIEIDGGQHDGASDAPRTRLIEAHGYRILRFWNNDVLANTEGVLETRKSRSRGTSIDALNALSRVGRGLGEGASASEPNP